MPPVLMSGGILVSASEHNTLQRVMLDASGARVNVHTRSPPCATGKLCRAALVRVSMGSV